MKNILKTFDWWVVGLAAALTFVGLFFAFDAGYARSLQASRGAIPPEFFSQIKGLLLGLLFGGLACMLDQSKVKRFSKMFWWICIGLLLLTAFTPLHVVRSGAARWLHFGPLELQPAELTKLGAILFMASVFAGRKVWKAPRLKTQRWDIWMDKVFVPRFFRIVPFMIVGFASFLIEKEPDLGTAAVIMVVSLALCYLGGAQLKLLLIGVVLMAIVGVVFVKSQPYRMERLMNHGSQWSVENIDGPGFQQLQAKVSMAYGGLRGKGIGTGRAKLVIPAPTTDFVLATIGEETGFFGVLLLYILLACLVGRLLLLSKYSTDSFSSLVFAGFAVWLAVQGSVNAIQSNDTIPSIGIPFPFVSSGGSSLSALWLSIGCVMACLRTAPQTAPVEAGIDDSRNRGRDRRTYLSRA